MSEDRDAAFENADLPSGSMPGCGPARVVEASGSRITLLFESGAQADAKTAVLSYQAQVEDQVLATVDDEGRAWIIGIIAVRAPSLLDEALAETEESTPTQVHDRRGHLVFEYDPTTDRAVLHVPDGDLELDVPSGALRMSARDGVTIETDAALGLRGGSRVEIESRRDEAVARVALQPGDLALTARVLTATAARAEVFANTARLRSVQLETHVERALHIAGAIETRAGQLIERTKDSYREVERLAQTRAGRLKLVARKAASLVGENTLLKARNRMKVKGERIHLA